MFEIKRLTFLFLIFLSISGVLGLSPPEVHWVRPSYGQLITTTRYPVELWSEADFFFFPREVYAYLRTYEAGNKSNIIQPWSLMHTEQISSFPSFEYEHEYLLSLSELNNGDQIIEVSVGFDNNPDEGARTHRLITVNVAEAPWLSIEYDEGSLTWVVSITESNSEIDSYTVWVDDVQVSQASVDDYEIEFNIDVPRVLGSHEIRVEAYNDDGQSRVKRLVSVVEPDYEAVLLSLMVKCDVTGTIEKDGKIQDKSMTKVFNDKDVKAVHEKITDMIVDLDDLVNDFVVSEINRRNPSEWLSDFVIDNFEVKEFRIEINEVVPNLAPVADFRYDADVVFIWVEVEFDGSNSYDLDGEIVRYEWDFGDGSRGYGISPYHEYMIMDHPLVTLTVYDDYGFSDSFSMWLEW
jgi:hypothetical protein